MDSDHESVAEDTHSITDSQKDGIEAKSPKRKAGRKVAGFLKRAVRAGVGGALSVDQLKAAAGSEHAKRRIGAISEPPPTDIAEVDVAPSLVDDEIPTGDVSDSEEVPKKAVSGPIENGEGPSVFSARMRGKRGHVLLINSATSPCVAFAYTKPHRKSKFLPGMHAAEPDPTDIHPEFTIGLADIVGLRKVGGFGWKGKMVVGWALGREVVDGLEITDKEGKGVVLTAIKGRDELFNRLIAIGGHKWECW